MDKENSHTMCTVDVESLYTDIPVEEAINVTLDYMFKSTKLINFPFNRNQMKRLLELSICNVPFRFQNKMYRQIDRVAMGNPLVPIIADLWRQRKEQKLNKLSKNKSTIWFRYADDIYCLFAIPQATIIKFHTHANRGHKNLHFTITTESNKSISFHQKIFFQRIP